MKNAYEDPHHLAGRNEDGENDSDSRKAVSLRERWESVRYGRAGRILGLIFAFAVTFLLILLLLKFLEGYNF